MLKCGNTVVQLLPPFFETPVARPCAPPSDQRSCCQTAIRFFESVGLTSTQGSSSALTYRVSPGVVVAPTLQLANGLGPVISVRGATLKLLACARLVEPSASM